MEHLFSSSFTQAQTIFELFGRVTSLGIDSNNIEKYNIPSFSGMQH
jgi:hypothetical protein